MVYQVVPLRLLKKTYYSSVPYLQHSSQYLVFQHLFPAQFLAEPRSFLFVLGKARVGPVSIVDRVAYSEGAGKAVCQLVQAGPLWRGAHHGVGGGVGGQAGRGAGRGAGRRHLQPRSVRHGTTVSNTCTPGRRFSSSSGGFDLAGCEQ